MFFLKEKEEEEEKIEISSFIYDPSLQIVQNDVFGMWGRGSDYMTKEIFLLFLYAILLAYIKNSYFTLYASYFPSIYLSKLYTFFFYFLGGSKGDEEVGEANYK